MDSQEVQGELTRISGDDRDQRIAKVRDETDEIVAMVARERERSRDYPRQSMAPVGQLVLLGSALWLFTAQWTLYPGTTAGEDTGMRDLGIAIVLALAASTLGTSFPRLPALAVCALCGVALVLCGALLEHGGTANQVGELLGGGGALLGVVLSMGRPDES